MSQWLYRVGWWCVQNRASVLRMWIVAAAIAVSAAIAWGGHVSNKTDIPGTESSRALELLQREFPAAAGASGTVVIAAPEGETLMTPARMGAVRQVTQEVLAVNGVLSALDPYQTNTLTPDGRFAIIPVQFEKVADDVPPSSVNAYAAVGDSARQSGLRVAAGGEVLTVAPQVTSKEGIGVAVAAVVLIWTLGSLLAAGLTLINAALGVSIAFSLLYLIARGTSLTATAPVLALMLGIAVGIDYSLFVVSRFRQNLLSGQRSDQAAALATGTAGTAVVFAGITVVTALVGLVMPGIPFLAAMGLSAAGAVAVAVLAAVTLQPALLAMMGTRVLTRKQRIALDDGAIRPESPAHLSDQEQRSGGARWSRFLLSWRIPVVVLITAGLAAAAVPMMDLRLALPSPDAAPLNTANRTSADLAAEGFGPGLNGRLIAVINADSSQTTARNVRLASEKIAQTKGVLAVMPATVNPAGTTAVIPIIPSAGPTDEVTEATVRDIRASLSSIDQGTVMLTGITALGIDVSAKLLRILPWYLLLVVGISFLLLMWVFRSILVPMTAALGFLLTIGASMGLTVMVFQWGWARNVFGLDTAAPIVSFLPLLVVGILFGLAMDYEMFLVSRMREAYAHGATARESFAVGMSHSARVVFSAAIIMISIFLGFVSMKDPTVKSIGFALAVGIAVDALLIRMTLLPALRSFFGTKLYWLPGPLDRMLPPVDIEGASIVPITAPTGMIPVPAMPADVESDPKPSPAPEPFAPEHPAATQASTAQEEAAKQEATKPEPFAPQRPAATQASAAPEEAAKPESFAPQRPQVPVARVDETQETVPPLLDQEPFDASEVTDDANDARSRFVPVMPGDPEQGSSG